MARRLNFCTPVKNVAKQVRSRYFKLDFQDSSSHDLLNLGELF